MENLHLINDQIKAYKVMLLDEDGNKLGEIPFREALKNAYEQGLDLMQVGLNKDVAICKILNYESWLYHEQKKKQKQDFKNRSQEMKSMSFRPVIGDNDFNLKVKKVNEFLEDNHKVKVTIKFKSFRETTMQDLTKVFIDKLLSSVGEFGELDGRVGQGGRDMTFILKPSRKPTPSAKIKP
ncbi:translation initiation factor IF-3 [archaeon]|nr:translation initiation factor IF-3 [archaeon]